MILPEFFERRRAEVQNAGRCLLAGALVHLAAAAVALTPGGVGSLGALAVPGVTLLAEGSEAFLAAAGLLALVVSVLAWLAALGLQGRQPWSLHAGRLAGAVSLLNAPFGTLAGLLTLAFLWEAEPARSRPARRGRKGAADAPRSG